MSGESSVEFSRAMALLKLAENAAQELCSGGDVELADSVSVSLRLAMELLEVDHAAGGIGRADGRKA